MNGRSCAAVMLLIALAACDEDPTLTLPGSTEWDRATVLAEASERVIEWAVVEGDQVEAGQLLLRLDGRRHDARIAAARGRLAAAEARLTELNNGPRAEEIARARAELASAEAAVELAELDYTREASLLSANATAKERVDQTRATRDQRRAAVAEARAALDELLAGTRSEQILQAEAQRRAVQAELDELTLTRERLDVRAPRAGRVDSLPFRPGDQPRTDDIVASLLVGDAPLARIFVPASVRAQISEGDAFEVRVEGVDTPFRATLRSIRSEPSFTPYYALTGDDASRLVYRAELLLAAAPDLPAGLPLVATPLSRPAAGD